MRPRADMPSAWQLRLGGLLTLVWTILYAVTGRLSDDGLHAYAGRALLHGQRLYADFEYHQAPLLPHLLSCWFRLTGVGMTQARIAAALIGLATLALVYLVARRQGASRAALGWAVLAVAASPSLMLHLGYVQSQGLAALLALAAVTLLLWRAEPSPAVETSAFALAGLAAGARVSFVLLLPVLLWDAWPRGPRRLAFGLTAWLLALAAVFGPHLGSGLLEMLYLPFGGAGNAVTRHHVALYIADGGGLAGAVAGRLSGWPNQLIYYAPLWLLLAVTWRRPETRAERLLLAVALVLTVAHGVLPRRVNHSYLVVAMPFWAALAARSVPGPASVRRRWVLALLAAVAVGAAVSRGISRLDWSGGGTVLGELATVGRTVAAATPPHEKLFTFAPEFAVAADRDVLLGLEAGYFAYFANMDKATARRCHVMNEALLREALEQRVAATLLLHAEAFRPVERTRYPWPDPARLWALAAARYEPVEAWQAVGEKRSSLVLWRRR